MPQPPGLPAAAKVKQVTPAAAHMEVDAVEEASLEEQVALYESQVKFFKQSKEAWAKPHLEKAESDLKAAKCVSDTARSKACNDMSVSIRSSFTAMLGSRSRATAAHVGRDRQSGLAQP